ncbi:hypothetical protein ILYODFUR_010233 [Ilyodon furcidens]|uniref:Rab11 family-interacting protein 3 n=1 Tax=Ilyodon furcidens TaxID=33524 RepID=A0ABV0SKE4_9TELE
MLMLDVTSSEPAMTEKHIVKDLTKFLDPSGLGVISFEDFHRGISAISNGGPEPQLYSYSPGDGAVGCPEEYDELLWLLFTGTRRQRFEEGSTRLKYSPHLFLRPGLFFWQANWWTGLSMAELFCSCLLSKQQNEVTDSAYLGSESTYSECETFTDEDTGALVPPEMHEDVETDSGIEATLHDPEDGGSRFSLNSELHSHSLVTVISGEEEHFEDFGESSTSELLLETSADGSMGEGDSPLTKLPEQVNGSSVIASRYELASHGCNYAAQEGFPPG